MRRSWRPRLGAWLEALLHVQDTPERTAAAFAVGVFVGFSPFLGFHTILGLVCAFVFRFNRVAVFLGVYSNLPWLVAPYYAAATATAALVGGAAPPADFSSQLEAVIGGSAPFAERLPRLIELLRPFLRAFVIGSTAGALGLATVAYGVVLASLRARRRSGEPGTRTGSN